MVNVYSGKVKDGYQWIWCSFNFFTSSFFFLSVCRTKASRLAEENLVLGQKLAALKEEGLKETEVELRSETKSFSISRYFS